MGLDITAYKNLKEVENPVLDEYGYPEDWRHLWKPGGSLKWSESIWPGKGSPINADAVYCWEEKYEFRAGSYCSYNIWREKLNDFKGDVAFQELIDFADNEGVIGSILAKKLYQDFVTYHEEAEKYDSGLFASLYYEWEEAFRLASENGAVSFH